MVKYDHYLYSEKKIQAFNKSKYAIVSIPENLDKWELGLSIHILIKNVTSRKLFNTGF